MGRNRSDLIVFVGRRLVQLFPSPSGVVFVTFFFTVAAVPDPCPIWAGAHAQPYQIQNCRSTFGLDKPLPDQFVAYLSSLLSGNWGKNPPSTVLAGTPVLTSIAIAFPETLELVIAALLIMVVIGIPLGVAAASNSGRWVDHLVRTLYLSGWATPTYLGGVVAAIAIGPALGLPSTGPCSANPTSPQPPHSSALSAP